MVNSSEKLSIFCSGKAAGGEYDVVEVAGSGTIGGDIAFNRMSVAGSGRIDGNVDGESVKIAGSLTVKGEVKCNSVSVNGSWRIEENADIKDLSINGSAKFLKDLRSENARIAGSSQIDGKLSGDKIKIMGSIKVNGSCECNDFKAYGNFEIGELLSADTIIINPSGRCYAKEIGGSTIEVKQKNEENMSSAVNVLGDIVNFFKDMVGSNHGKWGMLGCEVMEGDNIIIEDTVAKVVRGNKVYIGEGCTIDLVEYKGELSKHPKAIVKEERRL